MQWLLKCFHQPLQSTVKSLLQLVICICRLLKHFLLLFDLWPHFRNLCSLLILKVHSFHYFLCEGLVLWYLLEYIEILLLLKLFLDFELISALHQFLDVRLCPLCKHIHGPIAARFFFFIWVNCKHIWSLFRLSRITLRSIILLLWRVVTLGEENLLRRLATLNHFIRSN